MNKRALQSQAPKLFPALKAKPNVTYLLIDSTLQSCSSAHTVLGAQPRREKTHFPAKVEGVRWPLKISLEENYKTVFKQWGDFFCCIKKQLCVLCKLILTNTFVRIHENPSKTQDEAKSSRRNPVSRPWLKDFFAKLLVTRSRIFQAQYILFEFII